MIAEDRAGIRKRLLGIALLAFGVLVWVLAIILSFTHWHFGPALLGRIETQFLGVILGGASMAGGILLLIIPTRPRRSGWR
jgi:hypothetical protein